MSSAQEMFSIKVRHLYASAGCLRDLFRYQPKLVKGSDTSPLTEYCAVACLSLADILTEGELDNSWFVINREEVSAQSWDSCLETLAQKTELAADLLYRLDDYQAYDAEEKRPETKTPLREAILLLVGGITILCLSDPGCFKQIESTRCEFLRKSSLEMEKNECLSQLFPRYDWQSDSVH